MVTKAQSILEYIIVLSAIIVAVVAATKPGTGVVPKAVDKMFSDATGLMESKTGSFLSQAGTSASMKGAE